MENQLYNTGATNLGSSLFYWKQAMQGGFLHGLSPKERGFASPAIMIGNQIAPSNTPACMWGF
jgi:hypothetical protein